MRIFDCTTFFDENLMLEIRFNILNEHVDKFVITEAKYSHSGDKKKLNFNYNKFSEFKKKIIYLVIENEPSDLIYGKGEYPREEPKDFRQNAIKRIAYQRNKLFLGLEEADEEDYIFYSDNDEIPNFENLNLRKNKNKLIIFKQKLFYYKFNLLCDRIDWFGTKGCKKKDLKSFSWLRDTKTKKYPLFRLDTLFSNSKYINLRIINDGGWHFSQLKSPEDIAIKLTHAEDHYEYKLARKNLPSVEDLVKRKVINYDHKAKTSHYKFSNEFKLKTLPIDQMPIFLKKNVDKYKDWFDFDK